jgi:hypothetical protein
VKDVQLAALAPFEQLGDGGQGTVYRLPRSPGWLLKRYHPNVPVNPDELSMLIGCPKRMSEPDRRFVMATTAWPVALVFDRHHCVGFLMGEAPARFQTEIAEREVLRELQYLVYEQRKMWSDLRLPSPDERLTLVYAYVQLFRVLHRYGVIMGDVSMRNLLWTLQDGPAVFAIDCDSFRIDGRPPAVPQAQTPDWADPAASEGLATLDSDRYKLALLVTRVLLTNPRATPEHILASAELQSRFDPDIVGAVVGLLQLATRSGHRPPAEAWIAALEGSPMPAPERSAAPEGRPIITLDRPQPAPGGHPNRSDVVASSASRGGPTVRG